MISRDVMAGDTFSIVYKHRQGDIIADLPEGYDYVIGMRQEGGSQVMAFYLSKGEITKTDTGTYTWKISYELSKTLKGNVLVEMLVYSIDHAYVQHCNEPVTLRVKESFMNSVIADE